MELKHKFDFHVHTTASDGSFSPEKLVQYAKKQGVYTLAITDHDTVSGVEEASNVGNIYGINVIAGVEISIDFDPGTMHICGYFIDIKNQRLKDGLKFVQEARKNRNPQIIKKLNAIGINISLDEAENEAGSNQLGRPHLAKVLLKKGYVNDIKEAFVKYLAKGAPCYENKKRLKIDEATKMIIESGGTAVLAHPIQLKLNSQEKYRLLFSKLKKLGVSGVEAFSSHHTIKENLMFKLLANELNMLVTYGSDFHGETKPHVKLGVFGNNVEVDLELLIKKLSRRRP